MTAAWVSPQPIPPRHLVRPGAEVVSRRVNVGPDRVAEMVDTGALADMLEIDLRGRGRLVLDAPLSAVAPSHRPAWSASGRLHGTGPRIVRYDRVHIWIAAWSIDAVELRIRPRYGYPFNWGRRRLRRYFDLAHLAGDEIMHLITAAASPAVVEVLPTSDHNTRHEAA